MSDIREQYTHRLTAAKTGVPPPALPQEWRDLGCQPPSRMEGATAHSPSTQRQNLAKHEAQAHATPQASLVVNPKRA